MKLLNKSMSGLLMCCAPFILGGWGGDSNAAQYVYVTNSGSSDISAFIINPDGTLKNNGANVTAGTRPFSIAADPTGKFVYATNYHESGDISSYIINNDGTLKINGAVVKTKDYPASIAVNPLDKVAYVVNSSSKNISAYKIDNDGVLTADTVTKVTGELSPSYIAISPSGKFAYVANLDAAKDSSKEKAGKIDTYKIDGTTLTNISNVIAGKSPFSIAISPNGKFAYAVNINSFDIYIYTIGDDGVLSNSSVIPLTGQDAPFSIAISPNGKFAYVANLASSSIATYKIDDTSGDLAKLGGNLDSDTNPVFITVDPTGKFAYVANRKAETVSAYAINADGTLKSLGTVPAGTAPKSIAVTAPN